MADIRMVNCHTHLFTHRHVPKHYPHWSISALKRLPFLLDAVAWIAKPALAEKILRLKQSQKENDLDTQAEVFANLARHYPDGTRFVVLPMDLSEIGHHPPPVGLPAQHDELARLAADQNGRVIPFAKIDPRADPQARELTRAITELGFRGVKIYPRLGYSPTHETLWNCVYPLAEDRGLPIMTHCSRGGVQGRGLPDHKADDYTDPMAYLPILKAFPDLRICLAHFGGQRDWAAYVDPKRPSPYRPEDSRNWLAMIRRLIMSRQYPGLWTDISYTLFNFENYVPFLRMFLLDDARDDDETRNGREWLRRRVLFGSDYYMTKQEALSEREVSVRLRDALGEDLFRQIAEINPEVWLGERREAPLP